MEKFKWAFWIVRELCSTSVVQTVGSEGIRALDILIRCFSHWAATKAIGNYLLFYREKRSYECLISTYCVVAF